MEIEKEKVTLKTYEYLVTPASPDGKFYEVYFKGKRLYDVRAVIRIGGYDHVTRKTK